MAEIKRKIINQQIFVHALEIALNQQTYLLTIHSPFRLISPSRMTKSHWPLSFVLLALFHWDFAWCSEGDERLDFQVCLAECEDEICGLESGSKPILPLILRLTGWNCLSNCKYNCMFQIHKNSQGEWQKFYGKWPFTRFLGLQEVFSVLFSLGNGWAHWKGWQLVLEKARKNSTSHWMFPLYRQYFYSSIMTWCFSTAFHARDVWLTEKLDYFGAAWGIFIFCHLTCCRTLEIRGANEQANLMSWFQFGFLLHVCKMIFHSFDYTYNMIMLSVVGGISIGLWIWWWWWSWCQANKFAIKRTCESKKQPHSKVHYPLFCVLLFVVSTVMLEIRDFPPIWGWIDAHALWHLSTIPITLKWYEFYAEDIQRA
jgi:hypothetical protein